MPQNKAMTHIVLLLNQLKKMREETIGMEMR